MVSYIYYIQKLMLNKNGSLRFHIEYFTFFFFVEYLLILMIIIIFNLEDMKSLKKEKKKKLQSRILQIAVRKYNDIV